MENERTYRILEREIEDSDTSVKWFHFVFYVQLPLFVLGSLAFILWGLIYGQPMYYGGNFAAISLAVAVYVLAGALCVWVFLAVLRVKRYAAVALIVKSWLPFALVAAHYIGVLVFGTLDWHTYPVIVSYLGLPAIMGLAETVYFHKRRWLFEGR